MAITPFINRIFLVIIGFLFLIEEVNSRSCNIGYTYYRRYTYCPSGCCPSTITKYKCCTSYYKYTGGGGVVFNGLSSGSIVSIAISSIVGLSILITLIVCCTCSKGRHGRVLRMGRVVTGQPNVTVVSNNIGNMGQTVSYSSYGNNNHMMGYSTQPLQPMHPGMPPSYAQVTSSTVYSQAPPPYVYQPPPGGMPGANIINVAPY